MITKLIKHIKGVIRLNRRRKAVRSKVMRDGIAQNSRKRRSKNQAQTQVQAQTDSRPARNEKKKYGERRNERPRSSGQYDRRRDGRQENTGRTSKPQKTPRPVKRPATPPMPSVIEIPAAEGKVRFQDLALSPEVTAGTQQLGFKYCSVIQERCLPYAIEGKDLAAKAQTGTGKTAAFLASSMTRLLKNPKPGRAPRTCRVLVLEPTRELAMQIEKDAEGLGKYTGLYCKAIFGGMDYKEQKDAIDAPVDILAGTPGRIIDYSRSGALDLTKTEILVIDEADRMLDMGFIPDVRRIVSKLPPPGERQTMLFSATLEPEILRLVEKWLVSPVSVEAEHEKVVTDLIDQQFYAVPEDQKLAMLLWILRNEKHDRMLIFGNWKHKNAQLTEELISYGIDCELLSGDIAQAKRIKILDRFKSGECKVVVATDVAARGIHVDGISHVINYDLPEQAEDYVHRIGRTGRAGHKGIAISFVCEFGAYYLEDIEKYAGIKAKTVQPDPECTVMPERVKPLKKMRFQEGGGHGGRGSRGGGSRSSGRYSSSSRPCRR